MSTAKAVVKTTEKEKTGKKVSPAAANDVPVKFNEPVRADPLLQLFGGAEEESSSAVARRRARVNDQATAGAISAIVKADSAASDCH